MDDNEFLRIITNVGVTAHRRFGTMVGMTAEEFTNVAWIKMTECNLREKTPDQFMIRKVLQVLMDYIRTITKYNRKSRNSSLVKLHINLNHLTPEDFHCADKLLAHNDPHIYWFETVDLMNFIMNTPGLTDSDRQLIDLRFTHSLTLQEMAFAMNKTSKGGICVQLTTLLDKIRRHLMEHGIDYLEAKP